MELWDDFKKYMNGKCIFSDPALDHSVVVRVLFQITEMMRKFIPNETYPEVVMQLAKLSVPTTDNTLFVLKTVQDAKSRLQPLLAEMRESRVFKLSKKAINKQRVRTPRQGKANKAKAKGKAHVKPKAKAAAKSRESDCPIDEITGEGEGSRPTTYVDDLMNCIGHTVRNAKSMHDSIIRQAVYYGVVFALQGRVGVPQQRTVNPSPKKKAALAADSPLLLETWSALRKWLRKWLLSTHDVVEADSDHDSEDGGAVNPLDDASAEGSADQTTEREVNTYIGRIKALMKADTTLIEHVTDVVGRTYGVSIRVFRSTNAVPRV